MSGLNYRVIVPPTVEPVSLALAKQQCRVDTPDEDFLIQTYIEAARDHCESVTNRAFYTQTIALYLDHFPYGDYRGTVPLSQRSPWNYSAYWNDMAIRLPKPMAISVNAINYLDAQGSPQVLDPSLYVVDVNSTPGRIVPAAGTTWPVGQFYLPGSINVQYQAGSYVQTISNESVLVTPLSGSTVGTLAHQLISVLSVKDVNNNPLTYTTRPVVDENGDPTSKSQIVLTAVPTGNVALVTYQAGMIPKRIVMAMLLIIGHLYAHREENSDVSLKTLPMGVTNFLARSNFQNFGNYQIGY